MSEAAAAKPQEAPARAIAVLALIAFAGAANLRICDPLLPQIAMEFGTTVGGAAFIVTAFAIAYGVCQVVIGPLGDARGKLLIVILGSLWAGIATALCAVMPGLEPLALLRFLAGAGAAAGIPMAIAWLGDVIPFERRQAVLARFASGQIMGVVFGQAAGGLAGELMGWRATMLLLGAVHFAAGLLLMGERRRLKVGVPPPVKVRWRAAGTAAYEAVRLPWVRVVLASVFFEGLAMFGALAYVGADLHQRFGIGLGLVGAVLGAFGAGALVYSLSAGALVPRLGQRGLLATGSVLVAIGYALLAATPWLWLAPVAVALTGLGFYMLHNTLQTSATQMAPHARGLAVSLFAFFLFVGQSAGVALAAPAMDRWGGPPIYLAAAAVLLAVAFYFRYELARRRP